jgi:hypothetical protein
VRTARSKRAIIASADHVHALDELVREVAVEQPDRLAAVEAYYVTAVAAVSSRAVRHGLSANQPRELFGEWVARVVGARSLTELRTFVDDFWSGPKLSYEAVRDDLPRVQHLRRLYALCASWPIWQTDPSWPDATARAALEIAAERWAELSEG